MENDGKDCYLLPSSYNSMKNGIGKWMAFELMTTWLSEYCNVLLEIKNGRNE